MSDVISSYLEYARQSGLAPLTTIYNRGCSLRRIERALHGDLISATAADLARWRAALRVCDQTVLNYVTDLHQFYAWATDHGHCAADPAARLPVPRKTRRLPRPVSEADLFYALAVAPARIRPWLILAGWCGLRAKEIALLRRENVLDTMEPPCLLIEDGATKGHRERLVPIAPWVLDELRACGMPSSGWMFPRADGGRGPNSPGNISRTANRCLHECGIDATLHQFRHRFGTQAYRARRDLRTVQELLGHADPASTAGYTAFCQDAAAEIVALIPVPPRFEEAALCTGTG